MAGMFFVETYNGEKFWLSKSAVIGFATNKLKPTSVFIISPTDEGGFPLEFKDEEERDEKLVEMLEWLS